MTGFIIYMTITLLTIYIVYKISVTQDKDEIKDGQTEFEYFTENEGGTAVVVLCGLFWPLVLAGIILYYIIKFIMWGLDKLIGQWVVKLTNKYTKNKDK